MDAKELTKKFYDLDNKVLGLQKKVEQLESTNLKLEMHVKDLLVDVKMLQQRR